MPMLADVIDAVVGVDTHRDTHQVEIASAAGTPIATITISNDSAGYARLLAWILQHAPGPRMGLSVRLLPGSTNRGNFRWSGRLGSL
jgi:transposase